MSTEAPSRPAATRPGRRDVAARPERRLDDIARAVLAAFDAAVREGRSLHECYVSGVDAWHDRFPSRPRSDAAKAAVAIILGENYPGVIGAPIAER